MTTILVTGFGPFPGAPFNPTGPLVKRLARLRRPALAPVTIVPYVFQTSYAAVDRDLPKLIAKHKPDALLMFGLAPRAKTLRIETRARNAVALLSDVSGKTLLRNSIVHGGPPALAIPTQAHRLFATVRTMRIPVDVISRCRALFVQLSLLACVRSGGTEGAAPRGIHSRSPYRAHTFDAQINGRL